MKFAIVLLLVVAAAVHSQSEAVVPCSDVQCPTGQTCLSNPTRCRVRCSSTSKCTSGACVNGYCEKAASCAVLSSSCASNEVCVENPARCLQKCSSTGVCPEDSHTTCINNNCEPVFSCIDLNCFANNVTYICLDKPFRCVQPCDSSPSVCLSGTTCSSRGYCEKS